jgi:hypothetical protein
MWNHFLVKWNPWMKQRGMKEKSESWNTSISRALDKQVLFWWQQHYQHVWKPRYEPKQDTHIVRNTDSYYVGVQHEPQSANLFWFLPQFYITLLYVEWTDSIYWMGPAYLSYLLSAVVACYLVCYAVRTQDKCRHAHRASWTAHAGQSR